MPETVDKRLRRAHKKGKSERVTIIEYEPSELGGRVSFLREQKGWTLAQLKHECGVSIPYLSQIERGDVVPSREKFLAVVVCLDPERADELLASRDCAELLRLGYDHEVVELIWHVTAARPEMRSRLIELAREQLAPEA